MLTDCNGTQSLEYNLCKIGAEFLHFICVKWQSHIFLHQEDKGGAEVKQAGWPHAEPAWRPGGFQTSPLGGAEKVPWILRAPFHKGASACLPQRRRHSCWWPSRFVFVFRSGEESLLQRTFQYWLAGKDMDMRERGVGGGGWIRARIPNFAGKPLANGPVCLWEYNKHLLTC